MRTKVGILLCAAAALAFLATPRAHAMKFLNQFVEFELPFQWNCSLEGAEWVCQSSNDQKKRDAIIVLAAKLKGEQDSIDKYQEYLAKPRLYTAPNGKGVTSQPKYTKIIPLNGQNWADSLHMESEIPGFYTRYLATVKEDIGVLVTYSINKTKYAEYLPQFEDMVKSMKVFRKPGGMNKLANQNLFDGTKIPGTFTASNVFPEGSPPPVPEAAKPKPAPKDDNTMLVILAGAALIGFMIYKKRRGG